MPRGETILESTIESKIEKSGKLSRVKLDEREINAVDKRMMRECI